MIKYCKFCNNEKLAIEFSKDRTKTDGLCTKCKDCVKKYKSENATAISEQRRAYREANKDSIAEYMKEYRPQYRELNRQRLIAKSLEWGANNNESRKAIARRSRIKNPESSRSNVRNRRAKIANCEGTHTKADIFKLLKLQKNRCACCRTKVIMYHVDHIIPIARGGSNSALNLQILCAPCNLKKNAKDPIEFMQSRGFLL